MKYLNPSETRILVVDDDAETRKGTVRLLGKAGYPVDQAASGEAALQSVRSHRPDLLLLDRDMPGLDGMEVCRRLKQDPSLKGILVIMASAYHAESNEQAEALESGADGCIARPIADRELLARIESYVRILALNRSLQAHVNELENQIVERQRTEKALAESRSLKRAIIDSTTDLIWSVEHREFGIQTFNRSLQEFYLKNRGIRLEVGMRPEDLFPNHEVDFIERWKGYYRRALESGTFATEYDAYSGDVTLLLTFCPLRREEEVFGVSVFGQNITGRKRAEAALRESEEKLRQVFECSRDAIVIAKKGMHVFANPAFLKLFGFESNEQIAGTSILNHIAPSHRDQMQQNVTRRAAGEAVPTFYETRGISTGGREFDMEVRVSTYELHGETCSLATIRDITERKQAEAVLRERGELLRLYAESSPAAIAMLDRQMRYIVASRRWVADYRLGDQSILGRSHYEVFPEIPARWIEIHRRCLAGGTEKCEEDVFERADGSIQHIRWEIRPWLQADDTIGGLIIFSEDITERKGAEETNARLAAIVTYSEDAIISKNLDGVITTWNKGATKIFGYAASEMVGTSILRLIPEDRQAEEGRILNLIRQGESVEHFETVRQTKNGHLLHVSVTASPIKNAAGVVIGASKVVRDITERKRAEIELQHSERALRTIRACDQALVRATTEAELLRQICRVIVEIGGYRMAWVGFAENDEAKAVRVAAVAGEESGYLAEVNISWSESDENGQGPTGKAIRTGQTVICQDMQADAAFAPWREAARRRGYASSIALPLRHAEKTFGIVMIYAAETSVFDDANVALLTTMSEDLAYGIHALRMRLQHQRAVAALHETEEKHRSILTNAPVGIFQSVQDRLIFVNPAMAAMFGYASPAEMLASEKDPTSFFVHPEQRSQMIREAITSGTYVNHELDERRNDGSIFTTSTHLRVIGDAAGSIQLLEGFIQDITERRRAELEMSFQTRLSQVLLGLPHLADHLDETTFIQQALEQAEELTGSQISFAHFINDDGKTIELVTWSRPTLELYCRAAVNRHYPANEAGIWADALRQKRPIVVNDYESHPHKHGLPKGHSELKRLISLPVMENNNVVMLLGLGNKADDYVERDINATQHIANLIWRLMQRRREAAARARLAAAIEQAAETVVITDAKGAMLYVNPAFEKTSGYTRAEALGQNPRMLQSGKQSAEFYRQMWETIRRGEVWTGHFVNKHKNGTLYQEEATISPMRDADGAIISYVAVKRNVTREVQLEAQVRQTQKMEAIGTLAGGIAHDFNNILTSIFGYAHLLQQDTRGNPLVLDSVEEILKSANRAKELVQQILTFSRQREGSRQVIRLDPTIREALKLLRALLPSHIKIEMQLAPTAPAVLADTTQIYQVTMNLATNALHAMGERPGKLTITLESFQPDEKFIETNPQLRPVPYALLTVADTGHGMDANTLERIFDPFFTTKPAGQGTGLGLSVVHGIVKSHEGIIAVESQVGRGTTFRLYFPGQIQAETVATEAVCMIQPGRGHRILVVDDEPSLTSVLQKALSRLDYQVVATNQPGEAIRMVRENPHRFDLVITDLTMPEINGLKVASEFHAIRPDLPILLMSGYSAAVNEDSLHAAGIREKLQKPVLVSALAEAVQRLLKTS